MIALIYSHTIFLFMYYNASPCITIVYLPLHFLAYVLKILWKFEEHFNKPYLIYLVFSFI